MLTTIVLARLLTPEDFGIVAMATIVVALLESMTQTGVHLYVIRHKSEDNRVFNTAWTVTFIQAIVIAVGMVVSAPYVASYFGEEVLAQVIYCLAVVKIIQGLQSYGIYIAQKKLDFSLDFKVTFLTRVSYLVFTILFALWLGNFWAIVFGQLASTFLGMILGYYFHEFRPKVDFFEWRKIVKFSMSTLPLSIGRFVNNKSDVTAIGRVGTTAFLGQYHVAANLANLFTVEILMPVIRGLLPNLSVIKDTPEFKQVFRLTVTSAVYIFLPIGIGLSVVSHEFIAVLLGSQWGVAASILMWLSLYTTLNGIMMFMSEQFLVVIHKEKVSNRLMWFRNAVLLVTIFYTLLYQDFISLPQNIVFASLLVLPVVVVTVSRSLDVPWTYLIAQWWPPVLAALALWGSVILIQWPDWSVWILLVAKVLVGASVYLIFITLSFVLRGKPFDTPEALIMKSIFKIDLAK